MRKILNIVVIVMAVLAAGLWGTVFIMKAGAKESARGQITVIETADRTESTQHPDFIKEVYEPIIPSGVNVAPQAKMEDNGHNDVYVKNKVNDGDKMGASYWEGAVGQYPNILTADFEEELSIHAIKVCLCPQPVWGARTQTFAVESSSDGENFTELIAEKEYQFDPDTANEVVLEFDEVSLRAVRLVFTANTGAEAAQVAELEIYSEDYKESYLVD